MKHAVLYICYYTLDDPLTQSQVVGYLRELAARQIDIHLLSFEGDLSQERKKQLAKALAQDGITWHTLRYHKSPSLLATLYDVGIGAIKAWRICRRFEIRFIHARSHVPAAMALLLQRLCNYHWLFDMRGLMAEEYVDGGHWRVGSYKFHLTKRVEKAFFRHADEIVMLTERIKGELLKTEPALAHRTDDITVIPCCVDTARFHISDEQRNSYRAERGWHDRRVIVYVGKIGLWYLHEEMARFFSIAWRRDARFFFQILTQSDPAPLQQSLQRNGVPSQAYEISFAPPEQLPLQLVASDAGISFIRICSSKLASSPTKNGEYLAAGLPLVINAGIGDSDRQTETRCLGVVLREFSEAEFQRGVIELENLLAESETQNRCQTFAAAELSIASVGGPRYATVYDRFFNLAASQIAENLPPVSLGTE